MEAILQTIAEEYTQRYENLKSFCFLFPNKRCGIFLKKYFAACGKKSEEMPHILTISEFAGQIARKTEAGRLLQLFCLYDCYREIIGKDEAPEFDGFRGWGEIVLSDFNIVDLNLVDAYEIFKNVKDYRVISSNFLTEDQKEVMREYFGVEDFDDENLFWKNFEDPAKITPLKQHFLNLWQILAPLHEKFIKSLSEKGYGTSGSIFREASDVLEEKEIKALPYRKIVVTGFNALTESERKIFKILQSIQRPDGEGIADFIWDATGPILTEKDYSASRFVRHNMRMFPSPEWLTPSLKYEDTTTFPEIRIISSPSLTTQTKIAGEVLRDYIEKKDIKSISNAEVALVMPDESLLTSLLYSLPEGLSELNLTMGYSLRLTSISSFLSLLRRTYINMRESREGNIYLVKDLRLLLSHPYSYIYFKGEEIEHTEEYFNKFHKVRVSLNELRNNLLDVDTVLNFPSKKSEAKEFFRFLERLLSDLMEKLIEDSDRNLGEDKSQVKIYLDYLLALEEAMQQFNIHSNPVSIMSMADRLVSAEKIGFEGEPLTGLQIMGTLETRCLDFKHVIILSMNEGLMPRHSFASTFIPESLRKSYGLPPARYAEEIFGYYFYRLISRAEKVTLIYDGRTVSGLRGGESRYLLQLREFAPKNKIKEEAWQFHLQNRESQKADVEKTPQIRLLIEAFSSLGKGKKNLSASSLNCYRECEVRFFLRHVLNLNPDQPSPEFMDPKTIGDVLHKVMTDLYLPKSLQKKLLDEPVVIERDLLENYLENPRKIKDMVENSIRELYYKFDSKEDKNVISGVNEIIGEMICELVKSIIMHDLNFTPFKLYGGEITENANVKLKSGRKINFRFAIDRLDEILENGEPVLRIIDYKTGMKKRESESLEDLFNGGYKGEQLFQLFFYAWLLGKRGYSKGRQVSTEIYFVPDMIKNERGYPKIGKEKIERYNPFNEEFEERLEKMIESIFTSPSFREINDCKSCLNCPFISYCQK